MSEVRIDVSHPDEDGYCLVILTDPEGDPEYREALHIRSDEVGDFVSSQREMEGMAREAEAAGQSLCEYALSPFGPEWEREQKERYGLL